MIELLLYNFFYFRKNEFTDIIYQTTTRHFASCVGMTFLYDTKMRWQRSDVIWCEVSRRNTVLYYIIKHKYIHKLHCQRFLYKGKIKFCLVVQATASKRLESCQYCKIVIEPGIFEPWLSTCVLESVED